MRKMVFGRKLSRGQKSRKALFRSLIKALIVHGKITTTKAKAKAIQPDIDKFITHAMDGSLGARRRVLSELANDRDSVDALFNKIAITFKERKSGFTRIIVLPRRKGDNAEIVRLEFTEEIQESPKKVKKTKEESKKKEKVSKTKTKVLKNKKT